MRIHLAYDHATFALGTQLAERIEESGDELVVHAPQAFDNGDDYPQFTVAAALASVNDQDSGLDAIAVIMACSPTGALIAANKVRGARAILGNDEEEVRRAREFDDANVLVIDHRGAGLDTALDTVELFCAQRFGLDRDQVRRITQVMEFETSGTIAGWRPDPTGTRILTNPQI